MPAWMSGPNAVALFPVSVLSEEELRVMVSLVLWPNGIPEGNSREEVFDKVVEQADSLPVVETLHGVIRRAQDQVAANRRAAQNFMEAGVGQQQLQHWVVVQPGEEGTSAWWAERARFRREAASTFFFQKRTDLETVETHPMIETPKFKFSASRF